jgi:ribosomal protein S18 acetylase RimI-like enzyme
VIELHELGAEDWQRFRAIRRAALAEAPAAFGSALDDWSGERDREERWRARLTNVPFNLVATHDGVDAGMVSGTAPDENGDVLLISLWVAPHARGLGVGDVLVQAVIEWAASQHARLRLDVRSDNAPAVALYARHGFVMIGPKPRESDDEPPEMMMVVRFFQDRPRAPR